MLKIVTLTCYWNEKVITDRKGVSYEGPRSTFAVIRSRVTCDEFMNKLYHVTRCKKQYTCLSLVCRYPVTMGTSCYRYIMLSMVTPSRNSLELYNDQLWRTLPSPNLVDYFRQTLCVITTNAEWEQIFVRHLT